MVLGGIQCVKRIDMAKRFATNKFNTPLHMAFFVAPPCITKSPPELKPSGKIYQRIRRGLLTAPYKLFDSHSHIVVNHLLIYSTKMSKKLIMGFHKGQGVLSVI